jgi:trans-aconitate methyltransferase
MSQDCESPELYFHRRATHYVEAQILFHLNELGVFQRLNETGPSTTEDLATGCGGLEAEKLGTVLAYLSNVSPLLERTLNDQWRITEWGMTFLERYGRSDGTTDQYNFFGVRVGAYGPVWQQLGDLLSGKARYGEEVTRRGEFAAQTVFTVGKKMFPTMQQIVAEKSPVHVVELGTTSGLPSLLQQAFPQVNTWGVDRSAHAIQEARRAAPDGRTQWCQADILNLDDWIQDTWSSESGILYSVHFHEFLSEGRERISHWLRQLAQRLPGWIVVALEQPRIEEDMRDEMEEALWLYNQSNILIHHLIGNGQILSQKEWENLFNSTGCDLREVRSMDYLGYHAFIGFL